MEDTKKNIIYITQKPFSRTYKGSPADLCEVQAKLLDKQRELIDYADSLFQFRVLVTQATLVAGTLIVEYTPVIAVVVPDQPVNVRDLLTAQKPVEDVFSYENGYAKALQYDEAVKRALNLPQSEPVTTSGSPTSPSIASSSYNDPDPKRGKKIGTDQQAQ